MTTITSSPGTARTNPRCTADQHGTANAYRHHRCRCAEGREGWRLYNKRLREGRSEARRIDSTGTIRRLHALAAIGWTWRQLAERCPVSEHQITHLGGNKPPSVVHVHTARAVSDMYDLHAHQPAPPGAIATRARLRAKRRGWAAPLAWDDAAIDNPEAKPEIGGSGRDVIDEVAIRRVVDGHACYGDLTLPERKHLVRTYAHKVPNLAQKIGMSGGQLKKWVAEFEAAA